MEKIDDRLRTARIAKGMTIRGFAKASGISTTSIVGWESGRDPSSKYLPRFAEILEVSEAWLATGVGAGPVSRDLQNVPVFGPAEMAQAVEILNGVNDARSVAMLFGKLAVSYHRIDKIMAQAKRKLAELLPGGGGQELPYFTETNVVFILAPSPLQQPLSKRQPALVVCMGEHQVGDIRPQD